MMPRCLMDDDAQEQGEPLTLEQKHARLDAFKSRQLLVGGYPNAGEALENIDTLTDKQLDFWMKSSALRGRLEFFDALGDRQPTKKMLKWISNPNFLHDLLNFHVLYGKQSVARAIKAITTYASDGAVDPRLDDLAREYDL